MKAKQLFVLSFWIVAFLWGSLTAAHTYSSSTSQSLANHSIHSIKNNQLGTQIYSYGVEDVTLHQKKITQDSFHHLIQLKNHVRIPSVIFADYNYLNQANIYNSREVLSGKIYPTHFFW